MLTGGFWGVFRYTGKNPTCGGGRAVGNAPVFAALSHQMVCKPLIQ